MNSLEDAVKPLQFKGRGYSTIGEKINKEASKH